MFPPNGETPLRKRPVHPRPTSPMNRTIARIITAVALAFLIVDVIGLFVPAKFGTC